MSNVEWREINLDNVHEYIGKTVRVTADGLGGAVYSTLRVSGYAGFSVDGSAYEGPLSYDWDEAQLSYAWYPPVTGHFRLNEPDITKERIRGWIKGANNAR